MASSEEEVVAPRADRGSADEDEESVDEDFQADSDSDVAEEYDSAHESSGASDEEMADGGDGDADADAAGDSDPPPVVERPKKKVKTAKWEKSWEVWHLAFGMCACFLFCSIHPWGRWSMVIMFGRFCGDVQIDSS